MFSDLFQGLFERRMVRLGSQCWMICHVLSQSAEEIAARSENYLALAVKCEANGGVRVGPENPAALVQFTRRDFVEPAK